MAKQASTSNCVGNDGGDGYGRAPLLLLLPLLLPPPLSQLPLPPPPLPPSLSPSPQPPPLPPLPCLPLLPLLPLLLPLPLSLLFLPSSPWCHPHAAAAAAKNGGKHRAPCRNRCHRHCCRQHGGGKHAHCGPLLLPSSAHCQHITKEDWDHCGVGIGGGGSPPPPPHLLLPLQQREVWWLTYIGTTYSTVHTVLQIGHWCKGSRRAWDRQEWEENNKKDRGAVGRRRDPAIKRRLPPPPPPPPPQPQPPLPPGPEPLLPSS
jgi:hypothetical protein